MITLALALATLSGQALEVRFQRVAPDVYAYIGDKGPRSAANEGLNANLGLVITAQGAVLIDSGATFASARKIHAAVNAVTAQPIRWVINTGGQDHRWLGNGYFAALGAELIAHERAYVDMNSRGGDQIAALRSALGEAAAETSPTLPTRLISGPDTRLQLGGTVFELRHRGGGHTPGDILVWLPKTNVVFTGDLVYVDRLLGVIPVSNTRSWLESFATLEELAPETIVPGHGDVTTLATARAHTRAYLQALRSHMRRAVDEGLDMDNAVKSFDTRPYAALLNSAQLLSGNASRVYLEMERE